MKIKILASFAWLPLAAFIVGCEAVGRMSQTPSDSAGRFNILYPFHGLTPQGKQEAESGRLQRENEIARQKQIANQQPMPVWNAADLAALKKALSQRDGDSIINLGMVFFQASQSKYDDATFSEIKKHAVADLPEAQAVYGVCLLTEKGKGRNEPEGVKWIEKAAIQDCAPAELLYGMLYMFGRGVVQNYEEASKWLRKAAEQGYSEAQAAFGALLADGQGIQQDYIEAYKWLNLAAAQGYVAAAGVRDKLLEKMTPEQIAEGQRRALAFRPRERL